MTLVLKSTSLCVLVFYYLVECANNPIVHAQDDLVGGLANDGRTLYLVERLVRLGELKCWSIPPRVFSINSG